MRRLLLCAALLIAGTTGAEEPPAVVPLPAMSFLGSVAMDEVYDALKADALFSKLNKELVGSPILLRVTHALEPTSGGKTTQLASGLLAAGTLGIIPVVTNNDLVVSYDILVNGTPLTGYSYRRNFTRSKNLWSKDKTNGLGAEGIAWVRTTVPQFLAAARDDPKLAALVAEYRYYFGPAPP